MTADPTLVGDVASEAGSGAAVAVIDGAASIVGPSQITCSHCGESKQSDQFRSKIDKRDKRTYVVQPCKPCEAEYQRVRRQSTDHLNYRRGWKSEAKAKDPVKFMVQERISNWRRASSEMGVPSDLTTAFLLELWEQQGGRCYYTAEMTVPLGGSGLNRPVPECASLDRLEPAKGYVQGNVVWSCFRANSAKGDLTEAQFYSYIENVLRVRADRRAVKVDGR
jgi:hypothetical protein